MPAMTKGKHLFARAAGKSWWQSACDGVPAWRWPSSL
jgi:hypothetical protein